MLPNYTQGTLILVYKPDLTWVPESEFLSDLAAIIESAFKHSKTKLEGEVDCIFSVSSLEIFCVT